MFGADKNVQIQVNESAASVIKHWICIIMLLNHLHHCGGDGGGSDDDDKQTVD